MQRHGHAPHILRACRRIAFGFLPVLLYGQAASNSVTVTATQTINAQPDQAIFSVSVGSAFDKNLSDIVSAVQSSGITAANFVGLGTAPQFVFVNGAAPPNARPQVQWNFQLAVPISKVKDTTASLAGLAQTIPQNNSGLSLTLRLEGAQVSSPQTSDCNLSDLLTRARTQAQQLTSAAGSTVGLIQTISTSTFSPCYLTVRFALGAAPMASQLNSITVTASRPIPAQPDEISIQLTVMSDGNAGLDDITAALQQAGLSGATSTGVYAGGVYTGGPSASTPQSQLQWSFTLTAQLSKIKDTFSALTAAQQALGKDSPPLSLSFSGGSTLLSPQLQQSLTCPGPDLLKDARTEAQNIAAAAGASVGPILSLSGGGAPVLSVQPAFRAGNFSVASTGTVLGAVLTSSPPLLQPSCSATVAFVLVQ